MHKLIFCLSSILFWYVSKAQKIETIYFNDSDSSKNLLIIVHPQNIPVKGYMFLIPGMFQKAQDVLLQSDLPKYASQKGILTIIPTFKTGISSLGVDTATQASFIELLNYVVNKFQLTSKRFYLGGFSIGGTCSLKYGELALSNNYPVKPSAVFALDSPLDFERMYHAMDREIRLANPEKLEQEEQIYLIKRFTNEFGGTPSEVLANYHKLSPYSFTDSTQHAIKPLINLPVRLYTEPDVVWWLNDGTDYSGMNAFDFAAMTNELRRMGSKTITLITTTNAGYRKPGVHGIPILGVLRLPKIL